MAAQKPAQKNTAFDAIKWLGVAIVLVAAIVGNVYFDHYSAAIRAAVIIVVAIVMLLIAVTTAKGSAVWDFIKAARVEMRKVVWPTRQETTQTTILVIVVVAVMALILWGVDSLFAYIVSSIVF